MGSASKPSAATNGNFTSKGELGTFCLGVPLEEYQEMAAP